MLLRWGYSCFTIKDFTCMEWRMKTAYSNYRLYSCHQSGKGKQQVWLMYSCFLIADGEFAVARLSYGRRNMKESQNKPLLMLILTFSCFWFHSLHTCSGGRRTQIFYFSRLIKAQGKQVNVLYSKSKNKSTHYAKWPISEYYIII